MNTEINQKILFNKFKEEAGNFCKYTKGLEFKIPFFLLHLFYKFDEETIWDCLKGLGSRDGGLDGFFVNHEEKEYVLLQFKTRNNFSESENKNAKDEWFSQLTSFLDKKVNNTNYKSKNNQLTEIIEEIKSYQKEGYKPKYVFFHMGLADEDLLNTYQDINYYGIDSILETYKNYLEEDEEQPPGECSLKAEHPTKENQNRFKTLVDDYVSNDNNNIKYI